MDSLSPLFLTKGCIPDGVDKCESIETAGALIDAEDGGTESDAGGIEANEAQGDARLMGGDACERSTLAGDLTCADGNVARKKGTRSAVATGKMTRERKPVSRFNPVDDRQRQERRRCKRRGAGAALVALDLLEL
mmetsp:Transcript_8547/g.13871  ORF Transcript_8547/g.13871 Transcript_8547/m.13871 type:complete len:135 (+) Transcript_8547:67-471(+)